MRAALIALQRAHTLSPSHSEEWELIMDLTLLIVIVAVLLLVGGGGVYGSRRWR